LAKISAVVLIVFYRRVGIHMKRHRPLCENVTSSAKPEVYIMYSNAARGGPSHGHRQQADRNSEIDKFDRVVFELCE